MDVTQWTAKWNSMVLLQFQKINGKIKQPPTAQLHGRSSIPDE
jgi:hypothetical protein